MRVISALYNYTESVSCQWQFGVRHKYNSLVVEIYAKFVWCLLSCTVCLVFVGLYCDSTSGVEESPTVWGGRVGSDL